ncbi:MAG: hypothetical protein K5978_05930 [Campylobacter sp.]|nr:hypothetical protein [Campylobacter sp.]
MPFRHLAKLVENHYEDLINEDGATRYYRIKVVDKDGLESEWQGADVVGKSLEAPKKPEMGGANFDGSSITINWSGVDRAVSYSLIRTGGGDKTINGIEGTSYTDTAITAGQSYTYKVVAVDEYGLSSDKSSGVEVSTK